jgi:hypothetical protein
LRHPQSETHTSDVAWNVHGPRADDVLRVTEQRDAKSVPVVNQKQRFHAENADADGEVPS